MAKQIKKTEAKKVEQVFSPDNTEDNTPCLFSKTDDTSIKDVEVKSISSESPSEQVYEVAKIDTGLDQAILVLSADDTAIKIADNFKSQLPKTKNEIEDITKKILAINISSLSQEKDIDFLSKSGKELRAYDKQVKEKRTDIDLPFKKIMNATIDVEKEFLSLTEKPLDHIKLQNQVIKQLKEEEEERQAELLRVQTKDRIQKLEDAGVSLVVGGWFAEFQGEKFEMDIATLQVMEESTFLLQLESAKEICNKIKKHEEAEEEKIKKIEADKQKLIDQKIESDKKAKEAEDKLKEAQDEVNRLKKEQERKDAIFKTEKRIFEFEKIGYHYESPNFFIGNQYFFNLNDFIELQDSAFEAFVDVKKQVKKEYVDFLLKVKQLGKLLEAENITITDKMIEESKIYQKDELPNLVAKIKTTLQVEKQNEIDKIIQTRKDILLTNGFVYPEGKIELDKNLMYYHISDKDLDYSKTVVVKVTDHGSYELSLSTANQEIEECKKELAELKRKSLLPTEKQQMQIEACFSAIKGVKIPKVKHLEGFEVELSELIEKYKKSIY